MTIVVPVAIRPAGQPLPNPSDNATFQVRKLEQIRWANNEYAIDSKALADASYANALDAQGSATAAASSAAAAAASAASAVATAGVVLWVSGNTYATGANVYSPVNYLTYRRTATSPGSTATDPSADPTKWVCLVGGNPVWIRKTSAYTALSGDHIKASTTAGAWPLTFPPAPSDGDQIEVQDVDGTFATNNLTLLANGKKINGNTTSFVLDTQYDRFVFVYDATLGDWRI